MKKLMLLLAILIPAMAQAQFVLTPDGFRTAEGQDFYVVEIPGTQEELFNKAQSAVTEIFVSPKDVVSATSPSVISLKGFTDKVYIKDGPRKTNLDTDYSIKILFKDGKIRFNAPSVLSMGIYNSGRVLSLTIGCGGGAGLNSYGYMFKKDGKIRYKEGQESLEAYFNSLISSIVDKVTSPTTEDDW